VNVATLGRAVLLAVSVPPHRLEEALTRGAEPQARSLDRRLVSAPTESTA